LAVLFGKPKEGTMATAPVVGGVTDFVDDLLGHEEGIDLTRVGPATEELATELREAGFDGKVTAGLLASLFWRCFMLSPAYRRSLDAVDALHILEGRVDNMVVPHPLGGVLVTPRFDLLIFADDYDAEPTEVDLLLSHAEVRAAWEAVAQQAADPSTPSPAVSPAAVVSRRFDPLREVYEGASFRVLLAKRPETILTAAPNPAWVARVHPEDSEFASVGVIARNADGILGVTIPNHLFCRDAAIPTDAGTEVSIRGMSGTVVSSDVVTDSCFASFPDAKPSSGFLGFDSEGLLFQEPVTARAATIADVACCYAPGEGLKASFTGALTALGRVTVTAWDPAVYVPSRHRMKCIYTDGVTGPGDSGAALVSGERGLMGFAFEATTYDAVPQFSSWVWAEAVLSAHRLNLLEQADFGWRAAGGGSG
jgi:hypothetical protein